MDNKNVFQWINENPKCLQAFDKNDNGLLDDEEQKFIYETLINYSSKITANLWSYDENGIEKGPLKFNEIPNSENIHLKPNDSQIWIPLELFRTAFPEIFEQHGRDVSQVKLVHSEQIQGYSIKEHKGLVWGVALKSKNVIPDEFAQIHDLSDGQLDGYTQLAIEIKQQALDRMVSAARRLGANAVTGVTFETAGTVDSACEVTAYGTAVIISENFNTES